MSSVGARLRFATSLPLLQQAKSLGGLVVQRNHRFYLAFLFTVTVHCCLVFAFAVERLGYIANTEHISWAAAIRHEPAAICLMSYTFVAFW